MRRYGNGKKEVGALKALITEKRQFIQAKGKDRYRIENHKHLIVSSNEDFVVHLDADDRPFFVLDVSSQGKEDIAYFKAIENQLKSGGYEALLYELMSQDVSRIDPSIMPENFPNFDIKMMSATCIERFLYSALKDGCWDIALLGLFRAGSLALIHSFFQKWRFLQILTINSIWTCKKRHF